MVAWQMSAYQLAFVPAAVGDGHEAVLGDPVGVDVRVEAGHGGCGDSQEKHELDAGEREAESGRGGEHTEGGEHVAPAAVGFAHLRERGWLAQMWPVEYGGTGWNAARGIFTAVSFVLGAFTSMGSGYLGMKVFWKLEREFAELCR